MTLKNLLEISSGFEDSTFLNSVNNINAEIIRSDPYSPYEKTIKINLIESYNGEKVMYLENLDKIVVHKNPNYLNNKTIEIAGEIAIPGHYAINPKSSSLGGLIDQAGGLTANALYDGITIFRHIEDNISEPDFLKDKEKTRIRLAWQNKDIILMPGDSIHVKKKSNTILVLGKVNIPGFVEYKRGKTLNYYIDSAGGAIYQNSIINIVHPNGTIKSSKSLSRFRIYDGSTIIVKLDNQKTSFNATQFAANWTQIISSMITVYLLTQQISGS